MQPHRLVGQGRRQPQLHHLPRQQAQGPVFMPCRRRTASQRDEVGFASVVQLPVPMGLGPVLQHPSQSLLGKAALDAEHRALGHIQGLGHLGRRPTCIGLEQYPGPSGDPGSFYPPEPGVPVGSAAPASTGLRIFPGPYHHLTSTLFTVRVALLVNLSHYHLNQV